MRLRALVSIAVFCLFFPAVSHAAVTYALSVDYSGKLADPFGNTYFAAGSTVSWQFSVPSILTKFYGVTPQSSSVGPGFGECAIDLVTVDPYSGIDGSVGDTTTQFVNSACDINGNRVALFQQPITSPGVYIAYYEVNGNIAGQIGTLTILQDVGITSLSPGTAAAGGNSFTLTVNGTGFINGVVVQWNGTALATTFISATQLTAAVPSALIASAGTANVTVVGGGSAPFTVNPPGQPCTFTFAPSFSFGASGGPGAISVTASRSDCTWTPVSNASWIHVPAAPMTGSGNLNYSVDANTGATSRTGTFAIGAQVFTVMQGGTTCTYSLPGSSQLFGPGGGSGTAAIEAQPGCSWTAASGVPWVTINPPASGSGDGTVSYTVAANTSTAALTGTLTIANLPFTVAQKGSGNTASCTASVPSAPQVALEGRTEMLGDYLLNCSGLTGPLTTDISLALNTNVTNALSGGLTDAVLTVNGTGALNGQVAGYNSLRWPGVSIVPAANDTAAVQISKVRADASVLTVATPGSFLPTAITGQAKVTGIPVNGATETMANAAQSLVFTRDQANPPTGGAQTSIPLVFQEGSEAAFQAGLTRLRVVLSNMPATFQVYAPVYPAEGATGAQLYSADATGAGGSPVTGNFFAGGTYQQLLVTGGTVTATWVVLAADPAQVETFTFPLLVRNALTPDLNQMVAAGSLAPVSDVTVPSATAPVPRYRDFSAPQKLTNLRMSTSFQAVPSSSLVSAAAKAPLTGNTSIVVGSNVTFTSQLINDTSDPAQAATNVIVRDNLPTGLTLVSCTTTGGASCITGLGNQVQVSYGAQGGGQGASVTVVAQVDPTLAAGTVVELPVSAASDEVTQDLLASTSSVSFIVLPGTPVAAGGTPASGSGGAQSFTFQFSDPSGYQNLGVVNVLMNNFLDGRHACYLAYVVASTTLVLVDDAGDAGGPYAGSVVLGSSGTIQNSQCAVGLTSALGSGATLTLILNVTFKAGFGGNRITYVAARDQGTGNSNWQPLGVWQVPYTAGQIGVTVTPSRGAAPSGTNQQLTFTFTDSKGTGDFGVGNVLINSFIDGRQACYLAYVASSNTLILIDDAGDAGGPYAGTMVLNGGSGAIQNSQCMVSGAGSAVASSPGTIAVTLNLTFKGAFAGNRVLYAAGRDAAGGNNTDWQSVGTLTVQ